MPKFSEELPDEEYYTPQMEDSDSDVSVEETPLEKPKTKRSVRSEAQKRAFEKAKKIQKQRARGKEKYKFRYAL